MSNATVIHNQRNGKAMTNAERQRRYRQRHRPKDRWQEFLVKLVRFAKWWECCLPPDHVVKALDELSTAMMIDACRRKKGEPEESVARFLAGLNMFGRDFREASK